MKYWDKEFFYSVGNISGLRDGVLRRKGFLKKDAGFRELTLKRNEYLGIYEKRWIANKDATNKQKEEFNEDLLRSTNAGIEAIFGNADPVDAGLILVAYNPNYTCKTNVLRELRDIYQRTSTYPLNSIPDVFKKDLDAITSFTGKEGLPNEKNFKTLEEFDMEQQRMLLELTPKTLKLIAESREYGMIRDEWFSLMSMLPFPILQDCAINILEHINQFGQN